MMPRFGFPNTIFDGQKIILNCHPEALLPEPQASGGGTLPVPALVGYHTFTYYALAFWLEWVQGFA